MLKQCKGEETDQKALRFNLLGGRMGFVSLETEECCALAEHLAGDKRVGRETISEKETSEE